MSMLRRLTFAIAAILTLPGLSPAQETPTTTVLIGRVTVAGSDAPLPFASVTLNGRNAQFTDSAGRFRVEGIAGGDVKVRARRIGYAPAEETVRISRGDTVRVALRMTRLAIQLPAVQTVARICTNPGAPGRGADPGLVLLYEQLQQNAETFRLLSSAYPYVYATERQFVTTLNDSVIQRTPLETLSGTSAKTWKYEPGKMIVARNTVTNMHLPTLATFAEEAFAKSHCFEYGGLVDVEGQSLVRVDFTPDAKLKEPDVSGSMYLDPATYQIRRSDVVLSKVPYHLSGQMTGHTVTTYFAEIAPGIPIIGAFRGEVTKLRAGEVVAELQRVVQVHFVGNRPNP
jgi:hypothetical protein